MAIIYNLSMKIAFCAKKFSVRDVKLSLTSLLIPTAEIFTVEKLKD